MSFRLSDIVVHWVHLNAQLKSDKLKWAKVLYVDSFWDLLHESDNISGSGKISPHWRPRTVWDLARNSPLWASSQRAVAAMFFNRNISVYVDGFSRIIQHCSAAFCDSLAYVASLVKFSSLRILCIYTWLYPSLCLLVFYLNTVYLLNSSSTLLKV